MTSRANSDGTNYKNPDTNEYTGIQASAHTDEKNFSYMYHANLL